VWKARDPRLNRDVAIKISAQQFTDRFEREAHAIAALNHPNVCTLYDVGPNYLVMELVEGPTLAERIAQGPIPLDEALGIAKQIADALEAAHEKTIVHRDLKPANVKIKPDGSVKVLDFGLAKSGEVAELTSDSPTMMSVPGMILGTAGYMSPEQAAGQVVDKRADVWAYGVVLYEILTGQRLFQGDSIAHVLADVLRGPIDLDKLPKETPRRIRNLMKRCLDRDLRTRLRDIREARVTIEAADEVPEQAAPPAPSRSRIGMAGWIAAGAVTLVAAGLGFVHFPEKPPALYPVRFQVPLPDKGEFGYLAISPDGHKLAFPTSGPEGGLWVRYLDSLELHLLPGTQNAWEPFWSPDSRFLAFGVGGQLKKVDASGGPAQTLCQVTGNVGSGAWSREGVIVFGSRGGAPLRRVPAEGGVATDVTALDPSRQETNHLLPSFLPDGRHFVYFRNSNVVEKRGIFVGSLDVKPSDQSREPLLATTFAGSWAPSAAGARSHLFFLRDDTLMAQPFDADRLKLTGEPVPVAEHVGTVNFNGFFSISANGTLAYRAGGSNANRQLTWFDRQGKQSGTAFEPGPYLDLSLSPDGTRAAILRGPNTDTSDIWLHDFTRTVSTRVTFDVNAGETLAGKGPVWSPDGTRIAFASHRNGPFDLLERSSSGAGNEVVLVHSDSNKSPDDWSRDGRFLLYSENNAKTSYDLMVLPLEGNDRKPVPLLNTTFIEGDGSFSPDTRWFAYSANDSGRLEVYVQPFTPPGAGSAPATGKWQISRDGGRRPKWRADGKELIFRAPNGSPMAVDISTSPAFQAGIPKPLFTMPAGAGNWDVTADGKRFLAAVPQAQQNTSTPITVVLNWEAGLKK
jgi:Tol biopolymer transport system component